MTILSMPNVGLRSIEFGIISNTQVFTSPLTRSTQRVRLSGELWRATYSYPPLKGSDACALKVFMLGLTGLGNEFYALPERVVPRGAVTGSPTVKGAGQTGTSLDIDNLPVSTTGVLLAGDYVEVNGELKMIASDVNSNGSGEATITIYPALRTSPADNAIIRTGANSDPPRCIMRLIDDEQVRWGVNESLFTDISFSAIEVFFT